MHWRVYESYYWAIRKVKGSLVVVLWAVKSVIIHAKEANFMHMSSVFFHAVKPITKKDRDPVDR